MLLAAFTPTFAVLLVAQVVIGLAVRSASMVVPITSGILVSYLADYWLAGTKSWRLMFGLAAIPAVLLFVGMLFQAESPAWLVMRGRGNQARRVLRDWPRPGLLAADRRDIPADDPRRGDEHRDDRELGS